MSMLSRQAHRLLWQRLPQHFRRSALFGASAVLAPRPSRNSQASEPVIIAGAFSTASGLGQSARLCHDALKASGVAVQGIDLSADLMQPSDSPGFAFADGRGCIGSGTLILFVNAPLVPLAMLRLGHRAVRDKKIIGYWAWELPALPDDWRHGFPFVHEIWTPTRYVAGAVQGLARGHPVHVVPYPVMQNAPYRGVFKRDRGAPFTVVTILNVASSFARKNPCASIAAFRTAFGDDPATRLIVKLANLSNYPDGKTLIERAMGSAANISVIDRIMTDAELDGLYQQADTVLSLHRSEGFGLTLAEAMGRGIPVVATDWSGNTDFLTRETGCPVPCTLVPACDPQATYNYPDMMWAEADVGQAALALQQLRDSPALAEAFGKAGADFASRTWSTDSFTRSVRSHMGTLSE